MSTTPVFAPRTDEHAIELGTGLAPKFDDNGLITAVAVDSHNGEVLMLAHMNAEALARTIETGEAHFFSRSRSKLWRKGEESGNTLQVNDIRVDCDQDAVLLKVTVRGDAVTCHQGYRSCFYRSVPIGRAPDGTLELVFDEQMTRVKR